MIKKNQTFLNLLNVLSDAAIIMVSMICAFVIAVHIGVYDAQPFNKYVLLSAVYTPVQLLVFKQLRLYEPHRKRRIHKELAAMLMGTLLCFGAVLAVLYLTQNTEYSSATMAVFFVLENMALGAKRIALRVLLRYFRKKGFNQKHVIIIGNGVMAKRCHEEICRSPELGYTVHGYVADDGDWKDIPHLGRLKDFEAVVDEVNPEEVIAAFDSNDPDTVSKIIEVCETDGIRFSLIPVYSQFMNAQPQIDSLNGIPILNIREIPLDHVLNSAVKRLGDIVLSAILLIVLSPIMLICAISVRLSSPGPILFRQERVGYGKKPFTMYKFRSMRMNDAQNTGWTTDSDPRRTGVGAFIRKYSIDELPQLFNVLIGDMSLVGPRPEIPYFVAEFKEKIPKYLLRQQVRPGITGWAQVNGLRGNTSIEERVRFDRWYIENWSIGLDISILIRTLFGAFKNNEK